MIIILMRNRLPSPFTKRQIFRLVQIESICRLQIKKSDSKVEICLRTSRKLCGKRRKCWLPAFSPFPTMFSECLFLGVVKGRECVVKYKLSENMTLSARRLLLNLTLPCFTIEIHVASIS